MLVRKCVLLRLFIFNCYTAFGDGHIETLEASQRDSDFIIMHEIICTPLTDLFRFLYEITGVETLNINISQEGMDTNSHINDANMPTQSDDSVDVMTLDCSKNDQPISQALTLTNPDMISLICLNSENTVSIPGDIYVEEQDKEICNLNEHTVNTQNENVSIKNALSYIEEPSKEGRGDEQNVRYCSIAEDTDKVLEMNTLRISETNETDHKQQSLQDIINSSESPVAYALNRNNLVLPVHENVENLWEGISSQQTNNNVTKIQNYKNKQQGHNNCQEKRFEDKVRYSSTGDNDTTLQNTVKNENVVSEVIFLRRDVISLYLSIVSEAKTLSRYNEVNHTSMDEETAEEKMPTATATSCSVFEAIQLDTCVEKSELPIPDTHGCLSDSFSLKEETHVCTTLSDEDNLQIDISSSYPAIPDTNGCFADSFSINEETCVCNTLLDEDYIQSDTSISYQSEETVNSTGETVDNNMDTDTKCKSWKICDFVKGEANNKTNFSEEHKGEHTTDVSELHNQNNISDAYSYQITEDTFAYTTSPVDNEFSYYGSNNDIEMDICSITEDVSVIVNENNIDGAAKELVDRAICLALNSIDEDIFEEKMSTATVTSCSVFEAIQLDTCVEKSEPPIPDTHGCFADSFSLKEETYVCTTLLDEDNPQGHRSSSYEAISDTNGCFADSFSIKEETCVCTILLDAEYVQSDRSISYQTQEILNSAAETMDDNMVNADTKCKSWEICDFVKGEIHETTILYEEHKGEHTTDVSEDYNENNINDAHSFPYTEDICACSVLQVDNEISYYGSNNDIEKNICSITEDVMVSVNENNIDAAAKELVDRAICLALNSINEDIFQEKMSTATATSCSVFEAIQLDSCIEKSESTISDTHGCSADSFSIKEETFVCTTLLDEDNLQIDRSSSCPATPETNRCLADSFSIKEETCLCTTLLDKDYVQSDRTIAYQTEETSNSTTETMLDNMVDADTKYKSWEIFDFVKGEIDAKTILCAEHKGEHRTDASEFHNENTINDAYSYQITEDTFACATSHIDNGFSYYGSKNDIELNICSVIEDVSVIVNENNIDAAAKELVDRAICLALNGIDEDIFEEKMSTATVTSCSVFEAIQLDTCVEKSEPPIPDTHGCFADSFSLKEETYVCTTLLDEDNPQSDRSSSYQAMSDTNGCFADSFSIKEETCVCTTSLDEDYVQSDRSISYQTEETSNSAAETMDDNMVDADTKCKSWEICDFVKGKIDDKTILYEEHKGEHTTDVSEFHDENNIDDAHSFPITEDICACSALSVDNEISYYGSNNDIEMNICSITEDVMISVNENNIDAAAKELVDRAICLALNSIDEDIFEGKMSTATATSCSVFEAIQLDTCVEKSEPIILDTNGGFADSFSLKEETYVCTTLLDEDKLQSDRSSSYQAIPDTNGCFADSFSIKEETCACTTLLDEDYVQSDRSISYQTEDILNSTAETMNDNMVDADTKCKSWEICDFVKGEIDDKTIICEEHKGEHTTDVSEFHNENIINDAHSFPITEDICACTTLPVDNKFSYYGSNNHIEMDICSITEDVMICVNENNIDATAKELVDRAICLALNSIDKDIFEGKMSTATATSCSVFEAIQLDTCLEKSESPISDTHGCLADSFSIKEETFVCTTLLDEDNLQGDRSSSYPEIPESNWCFADSFSIKEETCVCTTLLDEDSVQTDRSISYQTAETSNSAAETMDDNMVDVDTKYKSWEICDFVKGEINDETIICEDHKGDHTTDVSEFHNESNINDAHSFQITEDICACTTLPVDNKFSHYVSNNHIKMDICSITEDVTVIVNENNFDTAAKELVDRAICLALNSIDEDIFEDKMPTATATSCSVFEAIQLDTCVEKSEPIIPDTHGGFADSFSLKEETYVCTTLLDEDKLQSDRSSSYQAIPDTNGCFADSFSIKEETCACTTLLDEDYVQSDGSISYQTEDILNSTAETMNDNMVDADTKCKSWEICDFVKGEIDDRTIICEEHKGDHTTDVSEFHNESNINDAHSFQITEDICACTTLPVDNKFSYYVSNNHIEMDICSITEDVTVIVNENNIDAAAKELVDRAICLALNGIDEDIFEDKMPTATVTSCSVFEAIQLDTCVEKSEPIIPDTYGCFADSFSLKEETYVCTTLLDEDNPQGHRSSSYEAISDTNGCFADSFSIKEETYVCTTLLDEDYVQSDRSISYQTEDILNSAAETMDDNMVDADTKCKTWEICDFVKGEINDNTIICEEHKGDHITDVSQFYDENNIDDAHSFPITEDICACSALSVDNEISYYGSNNDIERNICSITEDVMICVNENNIDSAAKELVDRAICLALNSIDEDIFEGKMSTATATSCSVFEAIQLDTCVEKSEPIILDTNGGFADSFSLKEETYVCTTLLDEDKLQSDRSSSYQAIPDTNGCFADSFSIKEETCVCTTLLDEDYVQSDRCISYQTEDILNHAAETMDDNMVDADTKCKTWEICDFVKGKIDDKTILYEEHKGEHTTDVYEFHDENNIDDAHSFPITEDICACSALSVDNEISYYGSNNDIEMNICSITEDVMISVNENNIDAAAKELVDRAICLALNSIDKDIFEGKMSTATATSCSVFEAIQLDTCVEKSEPIILDTNGGFADSFSLKEETYVCTTLLDEDKLQSDRSSSYQAIPDTNGCFADSFSIKEETCVCTTLLDENSVQSDRSISYQTEDILNSAAETVDDNMVDADTKCKTWEICDFVKGKTDDKTILYEEHKGEHTTDVSEFHDENNINDAHSFPITEDICACSALSVDNEISYYGSNNDIEMNICSITEDVMICVNENNIDSAAKELVDRAICLALNSIDEDIFEGKMSTATATSCSVFEAIQLDTCLKKSESPISDTHGCSADSFSIKEETCVCTTLLDEDNLQGDRSSSYPVIPESNWCFADSFSIKEETCVCTTLLDKDYVQSDRSISYQIEETLNSTGKTVDDNMDAYTKCKSWEICDFVKGEIDDDTILCEEHKGENTTDVSELHNENNINDAHSFPNREDIFVCTTSPVNEFSYYDSNNDIEMNICSITKDVIVIVNENNIDAAAKELVDRAICLALNSIDEDIFEEKMPTATATSCSVFEAIELDSCIEKSESPISDTQGCSADSFSIKEETHVCTTLLDEDNLQGERSCRYPEDNIHLENSTDDAKYCDQNDAIFKCELLLDHKNVATFSKEEPVMTLSSPKVEYSICHEDALEVIAKQLADSAVLLALNEKFYFDKQEEVKYESSTDISAENQLTSALTLELNYMKQEINIAIPDQNNSLQSQYKAKSEPLMYDINENIIADANHFHSSLSKIKNDVSVSCISDQSGKKENKQKSYVKGYKKDVIPYHGIRSEIETQDNVQIDINPYTFGPTIKSQQFQLDQEAVFLNHGSFSALPKDISAEMHRLAYYKHSKEP